jgi:hypothetical protein
MLSPLPFSSSSLLSSSLALFYHTLQVVSSVFHSTSFASLVTFAITSSLFPPLQSHSTTSLVLS